MILACLAHAEKSQMRPASRPIILYQMLKHRKIEHHFDALVTMLNGNVHLPSFIKVYILIQLS